MDISSLTVPVHDPTDADYILTAVLLASLLGGSSAAIQEWSDGFKEGVPNTRVKGRVQLAAAFKLRDGPQMERVVTVAERLFGVELGECAVATYNKQIRSGKYQKKVAKRRKTRSAVRGIPSDWEESNSARAISSSPGVIWCV